MKVEFIPVVELPTDKGLESYRGSNYSNLTEWAEYHQKEITRNYKSVGSPISPKVNQYPLFNIGKEDMGRLIELHVSDMPLTDSCALFGGYALAIDDEIVLYPQCCGLLSDLEDWKKILQDSFEPFYIMECHPSPQFSLDKEMVHINCNEENSEPFYPEHRPLIQVSHDALKSALLKLLEDLQAFSKTMESETHYRVLILGTE